MCVSQLHVFVHQSKVCSEFEFNYREIKQSNDHQTLKKVWVKVKASAIKYWTFHFRKTFLCFDILIYLILLLKMLNTIEKYCCNCPDCLESPVRTPATKGSSKELGLRGSGSFFIFLKFWFFLIKKSIICKTHHELLNYLMFFSCFFFTITNQIHSMVFWKMCCYWHFIWFFIITCHGLIWQSSFYTQVILLPLVFYFVGCTIESRNDAEHWATKLWNTCESHRIDKRAL